MFLSETTGIEDGLRQGALIRKIRAFNSESDRSGPLSGRRGTNGRFPPLTAVFLPSVLDPASLLPCSPFSPTTWRVLAAATASSPAVAVSASRPTMPTLAVEVVTTSSRTREATSSSRRGRRRPTRQHHRRQLGRGRASPPVRIRSATTSQTGKPSSLLALLESRFAVRFRICTTDLESRFECVC